ncbi:MAG: NFACT family protein [Solobacterium sp.]|nr:NFACT family protein [Solobacterium sp.]
MALDGIVFHQILKEVRKSLPLRIQKIYMISNTEVLFHIHGPLGKQQLLISCHSLYNRMLFTKRKYPTPAEPGNFIMVLRKYLEGAFIEDAVQSIPDRWCAFVVRRRNEIGDIEYLRLYVELMGKYANVILVNQENRIIDALKRIPPFENNRRTIHPGAEFTPAPSQDKTDPFLASSVAADRSLTAQFTGFSPLLSREVEYRMSHNESFASIMKQIAESSSLYLTTDTPDPQFHVIPLTHLGHVKEYPLFEGLDALYYHAEEKERIRQITGDLYHVVRRQLKHQKVKLPRLLKEADEAADHEKWKLYGDLLLTHGIKDTKGMTSIDLKDYADDSVVRVPLDVRYDGVTNARRCYQKYSKLKKGVVYLAEQIEITENEIRYLEGVLTQLEQADFHTASGIREELIQQGYLKEKKNRRPVRGSNKKKKQEITVHTVTASDGTLISYGRNNLQNDELTWHIARRNEIWLHAKDYHGSHVVIHTSDPSEDTLRLAAMVAAYWSAGRNSSSVPVIYCPVRNLKKIPGARPGMVSLGSYRMLYIDPDADHLREFSAAAD